MSAKAKKSRPQSTAAISYPQVNDTSGTSQISQFSPDGTFFALLALAVDKHRLRVFDTSAGSSVVEQTLDARVSSLKWMSLDLAQNGERPLTTPAKKRKKTTVAAAAATNQEVSKSLLICLGLTNGSLVLFSPKHARVMRTLAHPASLSPVVAVAPGSDPTHIWSSSADGTLRCWNAARNELVGSWKSGLEGIPCSALASHPDHGQMAILVGHNAIRLLSVSVSNSETDKPIQKASFTGHASAIHHLEWDQLHPSRFISTATGDRVIQLWAMPSPPSAEGNMVASIPLDGFVRDASLLSTENTSTLLTVSATGKVAVFDMPFNPTSSGKMTTFSPGSVVTAPSKKGDEDVVVVAAGFLPTKPGHLRIARLKGGVKPIFEDVQYLDHNGNFISHISLVKDMSLALAAATETVVGAPYQRYAETSNVAVGSGVELGLEKDGVSSNVLDGELDVDLAELSLGQRLTALSGADVDLENASSASDSGAKIPGKTRSGKDKGDSLLIPVQSLARTLVQALHSSDTRLLEMCLLHTKEKVVMNTVRRIPSQLAVPLLNACVERLGRGARGTTSKGRGGGPSAQRGSGIVRWVRAVLVIHTAHLMTLPDLVTQLAGLHTTITARLALRDPLLALNGRLDMVLSQVALRTSGGLTKAEDKKQGEKREPVKYVEGESSENSEEDEEMEVEVGDDAGSIEDVELGGSSGGDDDESQEEGDEENEEHDDDDDSEDGPRLNGFIDDEAEEDWDEESDEDSEE